MSRPDTQPFVWTPHAPPPTPSPAPKPSVAKSGAGDLPRKVATSARPSTTTAVPVLAPAGSPTPTRSASPAVSRFPAAGVPAAVPVPALRSAEEHLLRPEASLPMQAMQVLNTLMGQLAGATTDAERKQTSETLVLVGKDLLDAITFIAESSAQYQNGMANAAKNRLAIAEYEERRAAAEKRTAIIQATTPSALQAHLAHAEARAVRAERKRDAEIVKTVDHRAALSVSDQAQRNRALARMTVLEAVMGNVEITDVNYYRAFARMVFDVYQEHLNDFGAALNVASDVLAARLDADGAFDREHGMTFYTLFMERRALAENRRDFEARKEMQRLKTDEANFLRERAKALYGEDGYDPAV